MLQININIHDVQEKIQNSVKTIRTMFGVFQ